MLLKITFAIFFGSMFLPQFLIAAQLNIGVSRVLKIFDPAYTETANAASMLRNIHRTLVKTDSWGLIKADLAETWAIGKDFKSYHFCVGDARFHDGRTIGLEDIQYSLRRLLADPSDQSHIVKELRSLDPRVYPSDKSLLESQNSQISFCFDLVLAQPHPEFLFVLSTSDFAIVPAASKPTDPIGSGAYKVKRFNELQGILELEPSGDSSSSLPTVVFREMPYSTQVVKDIAAGRIDMYVGIPDIEKVPKPSKLVRVTYLESSAIAHLFFQLKRPMLQNKAFRQDLSALFQTTLYENRQSINKALTFHPHFLPFGLLPDSYYRKKHATLSAEKFAARWKKTHTGKKIVVVGTINEISPAIVARLKAKLILSGIRLEYVADFYGESMQRIKSGDYDLRFQSWIGMYEKPESFLAMFDQGMYADKDSETYFESFFGRVSRIRATDDSMSRRLNFQELIEDLESRHYFIPLFRLRNPIIHSPKLQLPDSKFKFNFDLQSISKE